MNNQLILMIIGSSIITYFTRFPLLVYTGSRHLPEWFSRYLRFIAPAVLTALIVPLIFSKQGNFVFSLTNPYLIAAAVSIVVAYFSKNTLFTVITGVMTVGILFYIGIK